MSPSLHSRTSPSTDCTRDVTTGVDSFITATTSTNYYYDDDNDYDGRRRRQTTKTTDYDFGRR